VTVDPLVYLDLDLVRSALRGSSRNVILRASITAFGNCKDDPVKRVVNATLTKGNVEIDSSGHRKGSAVLA